MSVFLLRLPPHAVYRSAWFSDSRLLVFTGTTTERPSGRAILTALDVYGASGVVLSQQILHHTCVIPRILHSRSVDLDSGVFPVGDNTCTAESGD